MKLWIGGLMVVSAVALAACGKSGNQASNETTQTAAAAKPMSCMDLANLKLPETTINSAVVVPAGPFQVPNARPGGAAGRTPPPVDMPSFCRVSGVIQPDNRFEVWLPMKDAWNGRFEMVGGGGLAGVISYSAMVPAVKAGYVTTSTDTGHQVGDDSWLRNKQQVIDYGYRSVHETTLKAKAILAAFYGKPADRNYFNGCSTGGRQGLMEAQRYPDDYDGIVSGAPVNWFINTHVTQLWTQLAAKRTPESHLSQADLTLVHNAVLNQCDALDGVKDGIIEDPRKCKFDPAVLECKKGQTKDCLNPSQVDAVRKIYEGPVDPTTGKAFWVGYEPGSEAPPGFLHGWNFQVIGKGLSDIPLHYFRDMVFQDDNWDWMKFDFHKDVQTVEDRTGQILNAIDPNLDKFRDHGGKLIIYHGWEDPAIPPEGTVRYYESVIAHEKSENVSDPTAATEAFVRLYMIPGMGHCRAGPRATDHFDMQTPIEAWVEKGKAPTAIMASHVTKDGTTDLTRPLCPYPQEAKYSGSGDVNKAENFSCSQ